MKNKNQMNKSKMNKKGQMTIFILFGIVFVFLSIIIIGIFGIAIVNIQEVLDQDIDMGQVNLQDVNADTFGIYYTTYLNNADWWGVAIIFGMVFGLFLSAYFMRNKFPKMGIVLDIFIILVIFITSLYISSVYSIVLDSLNTAGEPFLEDYVPKASMFLINLPIFSVIIGVITMILFHASIPRRTEERYQAGGYLRGAY